MKGLPSAETAAYSDICEDFEQRMGNPQWKGFPQFAVTVELIRASLRTILIGSLYMQYAYALLP